MISVSNTCNFEKTIKHLNRMQEITKQNIFDKYGKLGVTALASATPVASGKTAASWTYEIQNKGSRTDLIWKNSNINKGVNIAIILQYGHATRNGGYVQGIDYINPVIKPIFEKMAKELEREVAKT